MTRNGQKIETVHLRDSINTGIRYNSYFEGIRAAVWAGASLDELGRWIAGEYDQRFMATVVAAYRSDGEIRRHTNAAISAALEKRAKRKGNK